MTQPAARIELDPHGQPRRIGRVVLPGDNALRAAVAHHALPAPMVEAVLARWRETGRWYHAQWHVNDLFRRAHEAGWMPGRAQTLALLFHDAVYVPGAPAGSNEAMSVLLLRAAACEAGWRAANEDVAQACAMIEDTAGHVARGAASAQVVALDLATLADDAERFDAWTELVWLEYRFLFQADSDPHGAFLRRRLRVLDGLLEATRNAPMPDGFHRRFSANLERLRAHVTR